MGILESPCFDVPVSELVQFSFYFRLAGSAFGLETLGTLKVQVGTDDTPWTDLWVAPNNQGSGWRKVTLDLSDYAGQNGAKLRLIGTTGSRSSNDVDLDGLLIAVDGAVCAETSSLPYAEGFEDQLGWENIDWDLGDWTRTDEGTSSSQTGPASAAEGSYYLYLNSERYGETAVGSNTSVTLESQCFDLSAVTTPVFSFQYHMYGDDMGSLTVQVATESTRWADAWTLSGNQGNTWQRAEIDLSTYLGEVVQLRIVGVTGDGDRSDMAIDELLLTVTDVEAPSQPTNLAALNITDTSLQLTWDASTDNAGVVGYDVYQGPDKIGTFVTTSADISGLLPETTYTFTVVAKDANDNESPESMELTVTTLVATSLTCTGGVLLPYAEGFELGDGWTQVTGDDGNWRRNSGTTPSSGTGPEAAIEGTYYLHLEASDNSSEEAIGPDATAILESECFDLSQETEAVFSFQYHMYGEDIGTLTLQATSDGTSWIDLWTRAGEQGNSWKKVNLNLDSFVGGGVRFRIVGTTGGDFQGDLAIDDLTITRGSVSNEPDLTLTITFDDYPEETEWEILEGGTVVVSSEDYASRPDRSTLVEVIALPEGCYDFVMKDEYGDGMCCSYGNGSYELTYGATMLASGGDFAASETTSFCIGNRTASSRVAKRNKISDEVPNQTFDAFHIYPNPVVGNYLYTTQLKAQVSYQIINLMGQVISGGEVVENQIDVGQLKEGIYLIRFTSEGVSVDHLFAKGK
ncbi:MAG: T9SS type A sorting domain-containing protein, partial [Bacteroidota bacterium]